MGGRIGLTEHCWRWHDLHDADSPQIREGSVSANFPMLCSYHLLLVPSAYQSVPWYGRASSTASSSLKSRPPSVGSTDGENVRNSLSKTVTGEGKGQSATVLDTKQPRLVGLSQPFFASNPNPTTSEEVKWLLSERQGPISPARGKLRVLVADDNSTNIEVVSRLLKLEDIYDVTHSQGRSGSVRLGQGQYGEKPTL